MPFLGFIKKDGPWCVNCWVLDSSVHCCFTLIFRIATLQVLILKVSDGFLTLFLKVEFDFRQKETINWKILKEGVFQHNL